MLKTLCDQLAMGCHVDLTVETPEVLYAAKACADIITMGLDGQIHCQVEEWRQLMDTWKDRRCRMRVREFEEGGDDADHIAFREAAIREAWKVENDAVEELENPTGSLG
jgi:hypothetical protein